MHQFLLEAEAIMISFDGRCILDPPAISFKKENTNWSRRAKNNFETTLDVKFWKVILS